MRRQVKPFVTEYRGSARRSKDPQFPNDVQQEPAAPRNRSFAAAEKLFQSEGPDDSYEAALRAADALFNTPPDKGASPGESVGSTVGGFAGPAPEPRKVMPVLQPSHAEAAREVFADEDAFATAGPSVDRDPAVPPRRILQALEPATDDRFTALEAEHAPKRRGRKPGSKNKPKIVVGDDWSGARPALAIVPALPAAAPTGLQPASEPAPVLAEAERDEVAEIVDDEGPLPQPRGRTDKFGWKRAGLRPGERWKRRLPKAAR